MIDTTTIKKYHLRYWADQSQAARKAAEELAKKEVKPSLSDRYKEEGLVFTLNGHKVEFKAKNEKNPNDPEYNFFTYDEAMERFSKPNKDGWRLPTKEEFETLVDNYFFEFNKNNKQGIFDKRLSLPAAGYRHCNGNVNNLGSRGGYWSSTPGSSDYVWEFCFGSIFGDSFMYVCGNNRYYGQSVRLVRDVK